MPATIDGDSGVMNQADAILKYLAQKYPDAKLGSTGMLRDAYKLNRWLAFFTGDFHPAFFPTSIQITTGLKMMKPPTKRSKKLPTNLLIELIEYSLA
ncbi:hypothetical protein [Leptothermofonsia sp. ETS-13]|uniref:hypothetical protein n=1 Tax=Leptothermofonsia sp. ETS-13 TaxID=3035696 RepID=UPI003BA07B80